jgi:hypothetical protein
VLGNRVYDCLRAVLLSALFFQATPQSPDRPLRRDRPSRACFHLTLQQQNRCTLAPANLYMPRSHVLPASLMYYRHLGPLAPSR